MIVLSPTQFRGMPWKNGLGTTTEIHRADTPDGRMLWRVSIAGVTTGGPFSAFPGYDRHIMTIDGPGLLLDGGPHGTINVPIFTPASFSGDWKISARLLAGPVRDFNLIVDRSFGRGELAHMLISGPETLVPGPDTLLLYVLSGQLLFAQQMVPEGSALLSGHPVSVSLAPVRGTARIAICRVWEAAVQ